MAYRKSLILGIVVLLVVGALPMAAGAGAVKEEGAIEAELLAALQAEGRASFFVTMATQADLSAASGMGWATRGEYVWNALGEVARVTQAPVLETCRRQGWDCRSLLAANWVYVRGGTLDAAQRLAALPGVAGLRLERSWPLAEDPASPAGAVSWGLTDVKAPDVWALGYRGAGAKVANIDTGVQWQHPALAGQYGCPLDPGNPACWWDPGNICGGQPCDNVGHGTHTMGTMVALDDPAFPYTAGVAPAATWIACKGCEYSSCSDFALLSCADWVLAPGGNPANRPDVVNNSWGGGGNNPWYRPSVQAWVAAGIAGGFAAGGSGPGCNTLGSPCDYPESFCTTGHDQNRIHASFASVGPSTFGHDPYTKPNISAPAVNIWSTVPTNNWAVYSGTSMASPHSMGAMALVLSACPELRGNVYGLFELIQDNADPPPPGGCGAPPDGQGNYTYGYGYLNALNAVQACLPVGSPAHINKDKLNWAPAARPGTYKVIFSARIWDNQGLAAPGATVYGTWTYPDGAAHDKTTITDALGRAKFPIKESLTGSYQFCVTDVSGGGYYYDPAGNTAPGCLSVTLP